MTEKKNPPKSNKKNLSYSLELFLQNPDNFQLSCLWALSKLSPLPEIPPKPGKSYLAFKIVLRCPFLPEEASGRSSKLNHWNLESLLPDIQLERWWKLLEVLGLHSCPPTPPPPPKTEYSLKAETVGIAILQAHILVLAHSRCMRNAW